VELCLTFTSNDWPLTRDVVATFATVAALGIELAGFLHGGGSPGGLQNMK